MKKALFVISAALLVLLVGTIATPVSAIPDKVVSVTVHGEYENDWGEIVKKPLGNVQVTIKATSGESRTGYTDLYGYYAHEVNSKAGVKVTVSSTTQSFDGQKYKFGGDTEYVRITDWKWVKNSWVAKKDIALYGRVSSSRNIPAPLLKLFIFDKIADIFDMVSYLPLSN